MLVTIDDLGEITWRVNDLNEIQHLDPAAVHASIERDSRLIGVYFESKYPIQSTDPAVVVSEILRNGYLLDLASDNPELEAFGALMRANHFLLDWEYSATHKELETMQG